MKKNLYYNDKEYANIITELKNNITSTSEYPIFKHIHSDYTGFTTKCRKCNKYVKSKYIGKNEQGIACYELSCNCERKEK